MFAVAVVGQAASCSRQFNGRVADTAESEKKIKETVS